MKCADFHCQNSSRIKVKVVESIASLAKNSSSVVIYSSAFPIARSLSKTLNAVADEFTDELLRSLNDKIILMPTFTSGYDPNNFLSLDNVKSNTGVISENFRRKAGVRTLSAFFSFAASGPGAEKLLDLRPKEAWGSGSLYEWIYNQNALIITVGLHPTHCSFTHYAENLVEEKVFYRRKKLFKGIVESRNEFINLEETLFIRDTSPAAKNDFTWLAETYRNSGQILETIDGVLISGINAKSKIDAVLPILEANPTALISNAEEILNGSY